MGTKIDQKRGLVADARSPFQRHCSARRVSISSRRQTDLLSCSVQMEMRRELKLSGAVGPRVRKRSSEPTRVSPRITEPASSSSARLTPKTMAGTRHRLSAGLMRMTILFPSMKTISIGKPTENMCIQMKGSNGGARKASRDRAQGGRPQQSARLSRDATGVLDELAQRGRRASA
jgi:hypothetical protein